MIKQIIKVVLISTVMALAAGCYVSAEDPYVEPAYVDPAPVYVAPAPIFIGPGHGEFHGGDHGGWHGGWHGEHRR